MKRTKATIVLLASILFVAPFTQCFAQPESTPVHVSSIEVRYRKSGGNGVFTTGVTIVDQNGTPVPGVTVGGYYTKNGADPYYTEGVTDASGFALTYWVAYFNLRKTDAIVFTVTTVVCPALYEYDATQNVETSEQANLNPSRGN